MIFGEQPAPRDDAVDARLDSSSPRCSSLIDEGQWEAAQDKLQTLTTTVATVNDDVRKQELVTEWQELTVKVEAQDAAAVLPPDVPPPGLPGRAGGRARHADVVRRPPRRRPRTSPSETTTVAIGDHDLVADEYSRGFASADIGPSDDTAADQPPHRRRCPRRRVRLPDAVGGDPAADSDSSANAADAATVATQSPPPRDAPRSWSSTVRSSSRPVGGTARRAKSPTVEAPPTTAANAAPKRRSRRHRGARTGDWLRRRRQLGGLRPQRYPSVSVVASLSEASA